MFSRKKSINALLRPKKSVERNVDISDIESDPKYKPDAVLDKPDESDSLTKTNRFKLERKKRIERAGNIIEILDRERRLNPQLQAQQLKNTNIMNQLQEQFLNAQQMQNQLQQQKQDQSQNIYNYIYPSKKFGSDPHSLLNKYKTKDINLRDFFELRGFGEYPEFDKYFENADIQQNFRALDEISPKMLNKLGNINFNIVKYFNETIPDDQKIKILNSPNFANIITDIYKTRTESGGLIDENAINNIQNYVDPDSALDPLIDYQKYSNPNTWYVNGLRKHNELTNLYNDSNSRDQSDIDEILRYHDNKLANYQIQSGDILSSEEYKELKKYIMPKYHKYLDNNIARFINNSVSSDDLLRNKFVRTLIKSGSLNSVQSAGWFSNLWNKVKTGATNMYSKFRNFGEKAFRFIDSNPNMIPMANTVISRIANRPVDISPYYTKAEDIFSRLPNVSGGLQSMGITKKNSNDIIKKIIKLIGSNKKISIDKLLKSKGITKSSGINRVLLSSGLVQDMIDMKIPKDKIEKLLGIDIPEQEYEFEIEYEKPETESESEPGEMELEFVDIPEQNDDEIKNIVELIFEKPTKDKNVKNIRSLITMLKKYSKKQIDDETLKSLFLQIPQTQTKDEFLNIPELVDILNNSKNTVKSGSFFEGIWDAIKNFPRNLLSFASKAAPFVEKVTGALGPISEAIPIVGTVSNMVNSGFKTAANLNKKLVGRGLVDDKKTVTKF